MTRIETQPIPPFDLWRRRLANLRFFCSCGKGSPCFGDNIHEACGREVKPVVLASYLNFVEKAKMKGRKCLG